MVVVVRASASTCTAAESSLAGATMLVPVML